ncbi:hypothetical protein diail_9402 [Diaporthe ilicicola]|nr:hypothetical protein diail_9402 [Diaporthe ilicicola]
MGSLSVEDPEPLAAAAAAAGAAPGDVGVVVGVDVDVDVDVGAYIDTEAVGTGIVQSGVPADATSRTSLESTSSFPGTVEDLGCNELNLAARESKDSLHPNLSTGPDPLSLSPLLSPSSINSGVFHEGLNRLHSFQDLARLRLKHATQLECYETTILQIPETDSELYDLRDRRWAHLEFTEDEGGDDLGAPDLSGSESPLSSPSSSSSSTTSSTFFDDCQSPTRPPPPPPPGTDRRPFSFEAFFDAEPESPEGSPTLLQQPPPRPSDSRRITYRHMPPKTMPELAGLGDIGEASAFLSSTWASSSGGIAAGSLNLPPSSHSNGSRAHLRPRSAPKNLSRSSNPFAGLWGRKGQNQNQPQQQQDDVLVGKMGAVSLDSGAHGKRISDDSAAVEVHEGRTTPPWSASGTPNGLKDAKEPANASEGGGPPPLTREEFEALPLAIQRKYFSTLERLRFAQESTAGEVDDIYNHYDDISSHKNKRRKHLSKRSAPDPYATRDSLSTAVSDSSWFLNHPERVGKTQLSRQEQCELVKHLRASVILDAADEAIYKLRHKPSNLTLTPTPEIDCSTSTLSTRRGSFDSLTDAMAQSQAASREDPARESLYESFRWLDEEEDLDLRLFLDDYHANLREELPHVTKSRRPSFRRHLSISKRPFGMNAASGSQSDARDSDTAPASPSHNTTLPQHQQQNSTALQHSQRLSRTLSLMSPRQHVRSESLTGIDPGAAHYQDPEARLKLRVYLASPQKFDEAIEFGFPATDSVQAPSTLSNRRSVVRKRQSRLQLKDDSAEHMRSFLDDGDDEDLSDDDDDDASSISDPDSPRTPHMGGLTPPPGHHRPIRVSTDPLHQATTQRGGQFLTARAREPNDAYAQIPANSREMTLRMTLTRPDLRADDEQIYGWQAAQQAAYLPAGRKSQQSNGARAVEDQAQLLQHPSQQQQQQSPTHMSQGRTPKESIEDILTGTDHWSPEAGAGSDRGFMKRIFNRVRRA